MSKQHIATPSRAAREGRARKQRTPRVADAAPELSEEALDRVVGGTTSLMDACSKGKHVPTVTIAV